MTKISFANFGWRDKEAKQCAELLKKDNNITELDLSGNKIGSDGVKYIIDSLRGNNTLRLINLSCNSINDIKIFEIFRGLSETAIREVDFSGNEITDESVPNIVASFENLSSLRTLNLSKNSMSQWGMTQVQEALVAALPKFQANDIAAIRHRTMSHYSDEEWLQLKQEDDDMDKWSKELTGEEPLFGNCILS